LAGTFASVALGGLSGPFVSSLQGAEPGANSKVRLGVIGCGGMGRGDMECFFLNPEIDCPIICDVDDAMLAKGIEVCESKRGKKPDTVKDFRRVLDRKDIDIVLVATPDHWHALPTVFACQAGKDVYVEKPLATSNRRRSGHAGGESPP
jgi:predicted dehydrogenase